MEVLLLRISEPDLLCLDWDERSLRVLNAGFAKGEPFVRTAFIAPIEPGVDVRDVQSMGAFIRKTLAEHRIRTRRAVVDVPRQDAVLTMLNLPRGSTDELAAMVHIQVGREMPFARDQAVIDFSIAKAEETSAAWEVWAAAVRNNLIDHLRQTITVAGLRTERIGLRPYANLVAIQAGGALPTRTVTVDVGPSMTEINVIRDGRLVFSRAAQVAIPHAGVTAPPPPVPQQPAAAGETVIPFAEDLAPRPKPMDVLLVEVSRTIEAYRAIDPGARIDQIVLAGGGGINEKAVAAFETRFGVSTQLFGLPESMRWELPAGENAAPFSAVVGLALSIKRESVHYFDFAHPKEPEAEHRERVKRVPMMAVAVGLFAAAALVLAYVPIRSRSKQIDSLKSQISSANRDIKQRDELNKQLDDVRSWQNKSVVWLDTLRQIAQDVYSSNKDAYFTKADFSGDNGQIKLDMMAVDEMVAGDFVENARKLVEPDKNNKKKSVFVYTGKPGDVQDTNDAKYPVKDSVLLTLSAQAKAKSR